MQTLGCSGTYNEQHSLGRAAGKRDAESNNHSLFNKFCYFGPNQLNSGISKQNFKKN